MKKTMIFLSTVCIMLIFTIHIDAHASQQFMTEDDARYFLNFVYNRNINNDDLKNDENYKLLTGTLEDGVDANAIKFNFIKVLQGQINNNIDKASYNCDILRSDLQSYLEKKAAGMKDLPEQEYNAFLNKQLKTLEDAFVDWLCSEAATRAGIYVTDNILDNIKLASNSYSKLVGAPQKAIAYADYVINGFRAALLVIDEECAGRYSYFSVYLSNRKAYSDDTIFETIMSYNKLAITQNYPLGTIDWYMGAKDSWIEHIDDIERWADITIQIENSIEGVKGTSSSGSTSNPTPENTTITFTQDTYITDPSEYIGYAWDLNGYTVVVDSDLTIDKNTNINNGILIVAGNVTQSGGTLDIGSGTLKVGGDYYAKKGTFNAGSGRTEIGGSFLAENFQPNSYSVINFYMQNEEAYMLVNGDFVICIAVGEDIDISAGTLELKRNFTEKNGSFPATGTHKVILSGTSEQIIRFGLPSKSYFNILEIQNPNITWKSVKKYSRLIISTPLFFDNVSHSKSNNALSVSIWTSQELQEWDGIVILAVYDEDSMIDVYYQDVSETVLHTFEKLPTVKNGYIVKAFCWSDLETFVPLCEAISTTVHQ